MLFPIRSVTKKPLSRMIRKWCEIAAKLISRFSAISDTQALEYLDMKQRIRSRVSSPASNTSRERLDMAGVKGNFLKFIPDFIQVVE